MDNTFESGAQKNIPAVIVYAFREVAGARQVLMLHRNRTDRPDDIHSGKWNGLGGKAEPNESPWQAAKREFAEECGLWLDEARFRGVGVLTFPNFKSNRAEDWTCFVQVVELSPEEAMFKFECPEGTLRWIAAQEVMDLNLWPGDRIFLPHVLEGRLFWGTLWYRDGELDSADVRALE